MKRTPLASSCLSSVGYDARRRVLELEFTHGHIYRYFDVPAAIYRGLLKASSHGAYYQSAIRDRDYRYERLA
jgi:hypothetical protein